MAQINLENYEPVEERINRFYKDHPEARIITDLVSMDGEPGRTRWVVKALVFRDSERERPDATGYAFEIDGAGMTQRAAALETGETSAIGRALANLGYAGNRRVTREEMAKVKRHEEQVTPEQFQEMALNAKSDEELERVRNQARSAGAPPAFVKGLKRG